MIFEFILGATCPPLNPLTNALQFLIHNSALFLQQQPNFRKCSNQLGFFYSFLLASCPIPPFIDNNNKPKESISSINSKHKNELNNSIPIDCRLTKNSFISLYTLLISICFSLSDTNEKSTIDDDDNSPTIATTLATLPSSNSKK